MAQTPAIARASDRSVPVYSAKSTNRSMLLIASPKKPMQLHSRSGVRRAWYLAQQQHRGDEAGYRAEQVDCFSHSCLRVECEGPLRARLRSVRETAA